MNKLYTLTITDDNYGFYVKENDFDQVTSFDPRRVFDEAKYKRVKKFKVSNYKPHRYDIIAEITETPLSTERPYKYICFKMKRFKNPFCFCRKGFENYFGQDVEKLYLQFIK